MSAIIPRPEHPTPQWERKNWKNLNGKWQFEIDATASGEERGLIEAKSLCSEITLPFCPESSLSGIGHKDFMLAVWYKKILTFTEEELSGNRVILHFGAADFETRVWVNGKSAGFAHIGGFGSFEYDITDFISAGDNLVTVECLDDTRAPYQAGGKQSLKHYSYGCYYTRTTGIWQTVWYEIVPENYIKYAKFLPDAENCSVTIDAELVGRGDFHAEVYYEGKKVGEASKKNLSVTGQIEVKLSEKHLWEVGCGRLYDLVLKFGKDEVKSYFGLRSIRIEGLKFLINGKSVFQRLVLDQGFYPDGIWTAPTEEALVNDIKCSLMAGFNGARLHEKVFEPRFLYHADKLGYIVWGEYGNWGFDHTDVANIHTYIPDWISAVRRDINHPSIIGWCPFNETWDYGEQRKRQDDRVLRIIYEQTKLYDPSRPCIDTSGNFHVVTDIFDVHDYDQNLERFEARYDELTEKNEWTEFVPECKNRQKWDGKLPIFISEYGGIGISPDASLEKNSDTASGRKNAWSYGKAAETYEEFYARYRKLTHVMLDNPKIMGFCYTQLTDIEQEVNGLFTYDGRKPKFDLNILYEINTKKAAIED